MNENKPKTRGAHHVGLTVLNLDATRRFFEDALGFELVAEDPSYPAAFVSDGHTLITLWQAEDPASATAFDRKRNIGLHHLALSVEPESLAELAEEVARYPGVLVEFAPEPLGESGLTHMICNIPGGPRLELVGAG